MKFYLIHSVLVLKIVYYIVMDGYKQEERWDALILLPHHHNEKKNKISAIKF